MLIKRPRVIFICKEFYKIHRNWGVTVYFLGFLTNKNDLNLFLVVQDISD
jgi:hypothetical protein